MSDDERASAPKRSTLKSWLVGQGVAQAFAVGTAATMLGSGLPLAILAAALVPGALAGVGLGAVLESQRKKRERGLLTVRLGTPAEIRALYMARRQSDGGNAPNDRLSMVALAIACDDWSHAAKLVDRAPQKQALTAHMRAQLHLAREETAEERRRHHALLASSPRAAFDELEAFTAFLVVGAAVRDDLEIPAATLACYQADADQDVRAYAQVFRARREGDADPSCAAADLQRAAQLAARMDVPDRDALVARLERDAAAAAARAAGDRAPYRG